jgi:hypothetical protein
LANGGQVLFDGWLAGFGTELFDIGGDGNGLDLRQFKPPLNRNSLPPESPRTTKLYDRTREELTFEEVEKINI